MRQAWARVFNLTLTFLVQTFVSSSVWTEAAARGALRNQKSAPAMLAPMSDKTNPRS